MRELPPAPGRKTKWRWLLWLAVTFVTLAAPVAGLRIHSMTATVPIPPELALNWPEDQFHSPDNAWHLYWKLESDRIPPGPGVVALLNEFKDDSLERVPPTLWNAQLAERARRWLEAHQNVLDTFRQATEKPFFVERRPTADILLPHPSNVHACLTLLQFDFELALRSADETRAVEDMLLVLRAAHHLPAYAPLLSRLPATRFEQSVAETLWDALAAGRIRHKTSLRHLIAAITELDNGRWPLADTLRAEYLMMRSALDWAARQPIASGVNLLTQRSEEFAWQHLQWSDAQVFLDLRLFLPRTQRNLADHFKELVHRAEQGFPKCLQPSSTPPHPKDAIGQALFNAEQFSKIASREAHTIAATRALQLAAAIQWYRLDHHAFPATLDALVPAYLPAIPLDPYSGKPLQLRRDGDTWVLWSIGPDLLDDLGQKALPLISHRPGETGDLVWRLEPPK